jgi:predicted Zn-dependent protease with MMP-like domain
MTKQQVNVVFKLVDEVRQSIILILVRVESMNRERLIENRLIAARKIGFEQGVGIGQANSVRYGLVPNSVVAVSPNQFTSTINPGDLVVSLADLDKLFPV